MNVNKIKNAFSFIGMEGLATKITTLSLISGIGILLFTQHLIFSSSSKGLHLPQNPDFVKTNFSREDFINGEVFSGELINELVVLLSNRPSRHALYNVYIRCQNFINLSNANNSKCMILGKAYPTSLRNSIGTSIPAVIDIEFNEVTCEVSGIIETHEIDGHIMNIITETVPASVAFKQKLQSLENKLKTETDKKRVAVLKSQIKKIEEAGPALVVPAHTQIQGRIIQKDDKVVIETLNK